MESETKMAKFVYVVGYGSMEESDYKYLTHTNRYTPEELKNLVEESAVKAVKAKLAEKEAYVHNYEDIHEEVVNILVKEYGFERLKVEAEWSCFGWSSIFDLNDWQGQREENVNSLTKRIRKEGFDRKNDSYLSWDAAFKETEQK